MKAIAVFAACCLSGCGETDTTVSRASFERNGKIWPLIVDQATVGCDGRSKWVEVDGIRYGINGFARSSGLPGMEPVWRVDAQAEKMVRAAGDPNRFKPRAPDIDLSLAAERFCS